MSIPPAGDTPRFPPQLRVEDGGGPAVQIDPDSLPVEFTMPDEYFVVRLSGGGGTLVCAVDPDLDKQLHAAVYNGAYRTTGLAIPHLNGEPFKVRGDSILGYTKSTPVSRAKGQVIRSLLSGQAI